MPASLLLAISLLVPRPLPAPTDSLRVATFETIWRTVDRAFFDPAHLGVDWSAVHDRYRARLDSVSSDAEFLRLMTRMLREIPASHMDLLLPPAPGDSGAAGPPSMEWAELPGRPGIRRVTIRAFDGLDPARIDSMMADLAGSRGVILDVRGNEGGDVSALELASHFFADPAVIGGLVSRGWLEATGSPLDRPVPLDSFQVLGPPFDLQRMFRILGSDGAVAFRAGDAPPVYDGCVAVLIDGRTGSAAEAFAMVMDRRTKAPLIGEPTAGALLSSQEFPLPNGWRLRVPVAVTVDGNGKIFHDVPIQPDVRVDAPGKAAVDAAVRAIDGCAAGS